MISSIALRRHRPSALQKKLNLPVVERDVVVDPAVDGVMVSTKKALTQRVMMREEEGDEKDPHRDQEEGVDPEIREIQEIREIFGAGTIAAIATWNLSKLNNIKPAGELVIYLSWAMIFSKMLCQRGSDDLDGWS